MGFLTQINWLAVLVGGVFNMLVGSLWYGPLFGTLWLRVIGKNRDDIETHATMYLLPLLASLVSAYVLAAIIAGLGLAVWWHGLVTGALVWLGIGATGTLTVGTFEDSPRGAWLLFTSYQLLVFAALGVMFVLWN